MNLHKNKIKLFFGLIIISAFFLYLRIQAIGHPLMWDEAWNILSLKAYLANDVSNPFYWFYRYHPPLYMFFGGLLSPFQAGIDLRLEWLSLLFAYATFIIVYFFSARIGGWKHAWLTGSILAFMPASIAYDTWIKRDCFSSLAGYAALFLLYKKKFFWCGVALALSLLGKESGLFFVLASFCMLFVLKEKKPFHKILLISTIIAVLSSWWYLFFSEMTFYGIKFFFLKTDYSMLWSNSCLYYAKKLVLDLSWPVLILAAIGMCVIYFKTFRKNQPRWFFPVAVFIAVYVPISFLFVLKVPWLSIPAFPALAMISGSGAFWLLKRSKRSRTFAVLFFIIFALLVYTGSIFSYSGYHSKTYPNGWPGACSSRDLALYLNAHMNKDDEFLITEFEYWKMSICPVFLFYCNATPARIVKPDENVSLLINEIKQKKISYLVVVDTPIKESRTRPLAKSIRDSLGSDFKKIGWAYVWDVRDL